MSAPFDPIDILARTLWGEARGETKAGREAVASVVLNRIAYARQKGGRYWWGNDVVSVCLKPWQFSCWNANDPNRAKLEAVGVGNKIFDQCLRIARQAVDGELEDSVSGATHYHVDGLSPPWAKSREPVAKVGRHVFYKDIG
ncbi:MAG: cell wall hydrolase [Alphaproteobacteria bacterium]|nr:cell wall hydrolase [Alphaproteobacteria bacterium]